ncbi:MAG: glycosyltransferase [Verrucomicrobiae bacterium]|nr:glycosyltransferase [Verrucomicrobiae bacterium]
MNLHGILGALALLSLALTLWQWLAARRFSLHQRATDNSFAPAVTLLKPLKGCDEHTESCLRSWLAQDYVGEVQVLFGVAEAGDPACAVVAKLLREFPKRDAQLMVCPERLGANAKVSTLAQLEPLVKHEFIVISDADVSVPPDLLANVVARFPPNQRADHLVRTHSAQETRTQADPCSAPPGNGPTAGGLGEQHVGLVNCFYRLANPTTLAMQWEAIAINADFWSQVLQSASFRKLDFALGAVMALRRQPLANIGGFRALVNCLADDYQLGHRLARQGQRIELCPVVVECWSAPMSWRAVWQHQLRWARTIRVCQPVPYFFSLLNNVTFWSLLWLVTSLAATSFAEYSFAVGEIIVSVEIFWGLPCAALCLLVRMLAALDLQSRLTGARAHWKYWWLVPVKDLLQVALWAGAFLGNRVEWRGERYRLRRDGTLNR